MQPDQSQGFSEFTNALPGDPAASLTTAAVLIKNGWIEMVNGLVRLTLSGREVLESLKASLQPI